MPRSRFLIPAVLLIAAAISAPSVQAQSIDSLAIRAHTRFLADDALLGRGTGTEGERLAAAYIASQLERLGLRPAGSASSFLLPIPLRAAEVDPQSRVVVSTGLDSAVFEHGRDFIVNTGGAGAFRDFRGRAHFLGQPVHAAPIVAAERSFVGRVPVFLGPLGAAAVDLVPALSHAGAAGIILLVPDSTQFDLYVRSRGEFRFFVDAMVDDPVWQPPLPVRFLREGAAEGPLLGGCLSLLEAVAGTPWEPDLRGALLFVEDVNEPSYKVDRMLTHLRLSGTLSTVRAIVAGHLGSAWESDAIVPWHRETLLAIPGPVAFGLASGHGLPNLTLPLGATARLDAAAGALTIV